MKRKIIIVLMLVFLCFLSVPYVHADTIYGSTAVNPEVIKQEAISLAVTCLVPIIFILQMIARGLMLRKRGIDGWKIIIPFYGRYLEYQAYWKIKYFWINFGISTYLLLSLTFIYYSENTLLNGIMAVLFMICVLIYLIIVFCLRRHSLDTFGYSKHLAFLELLGLGFIPDFLCGFTIRKQVQEQKNEDNSILQEHIDNWE